MKIRTNIQKNGEGTENSVTKKQKYNIEMLEFSNGRKKNKISIRRALHLPPSILRIVMNMFPFDAPLDLSEKNMICSIDSVKMSYKKRMKTTFDDIQSFLGHLGKRSCYRIRIHTTWGKKSMRKEYKGLQGL